MRAKVTVSIVMPSFNRADLIAYSLESVVKQARTDWELVVIDDGSTDLTKSIISEYGSQDPRIRLADRVGLPKGACTCRNEGVGLSSGKYVMFLDTDDILEPFCLDQRVTAMERDPTLDFAIFPSLMFEDVPYDLGLWWNIDKPEDELGRQFKQDAICQGTGVLWRKDSFQRIGMWDEDLAIWQDIDLFFRAFIQGYRYAKFFDLPPDLHNRVTRTSLSRSDFHTPAKTASRAKVVRRAVELLKARGMGDRVREARPMVAEIVSGAARSGQFETAQELLRWAAAADVLSQRECRRLAATVLARRTRLTKLPTVAKWVAGVEATFCAASTLGRLPYDGGPPGRGPACSDHPSSRPVLPQAEQAS
jgi:hypothetical protein